MNPEPQTPPPKPPPQHRSSEHHPALRWIILGAALMPMIVTIAYMYLQPAPKMLKRNFPPAQTSPAPEEPAPSPDLAPATTPR